MTGVGELVAPPATRRERLRRTLRLLHAAVLVLFALALAASLARGDSSGYVVAHGVLIGGCLLAAVLTLVRGERPEHLLVVGTLAALTVLPPFRDAGDVSSGLMVNAVLLNAVRTLGPRACAAVFAVTVVGHAGLRGVLAGGLTVAEVADPYLLSVTNIAVAGLIIASLERSTSDLDAAAAASTAQGLALLRRDSADRAVDGARRVLHDDILTALRAVADEPPRDAGERGNRVGGVCRAAVGSFEQLDAGEEPAATDLTLATLLAEVVRRSPVEVTVVGDQELVVLGRDTEVALGRALLEALRNAERHAPGASARLAVTRGAGAVTLSVEDDGPGFGPDAVEGFGLTESVRAPVAAVGGSVEIGAGSSGARVSVTVPCAGAGRPTPSVPQAFRSVLGAGAARRLAVTGMVPLVAFWTFVAVTEIPDSSAPAPHGLLLAALLVLVAVVWFRLVRGEPTRLWVLGVGVALVLLQVAGLVLLPAGGMLDLRSWPIGFVAVPQIILCFMLPARWGLGLVASQVVVVLGAALADPALAGGAMPVNSLNAVTTPALITTLLGVRLRRNAAAAEAERARAGAATAELVRRRAHAEAHSLHLDHTRQVIVPWLRALADQPGPVTDEQRDHARLLALEARDDLHVPGFHTPGLRHAVTDFRRRGGRVDLRPGFDHDDQRQEGAARLAALLPRLSPTSRVTLTACGEGVPGVRTVVTPPPAPEVVAALAASGDVEVEVDDYLVVLTPAARERASA